VTPEQHDDKDFSVQNHGDKGQFTGCGACAFSGDRLPWQLAFQGKTARALPKFDGVTYVETSSGVDKKGHPSVCFIPAGCGRNSTVSEIGSFCVTYNHWSNLETSKAFVVDIVVPYVKKTCADLGLIYGIQAIVLILDCWWGWLGEFVDWVKVCKFS
jgi:hypothetical protein